MLRRFIVPRAVLPLLSAATAPDEVVITEAYRFGADPSRLYTLAVRDGKGPAAPLKVTAPAAFGVRSLDLSGFASGHARARIELTGPKAIWSAQRTLPGTNLDFVAASIQATEPGWAAMPTTAPSFDFETFVAIQPPPKDPLGFGDRATAVDWGASWSSGGPSYGRMLRLGLKTVMAASRTLH